MKMLATQTITLIIGLFLVLLATMNRDKKTQTMYALVGVVIIGWGMGIFHGYSVTAGTMPATPLFMVAFGVLSFYTRGTVQTVSAAITIILFLNWIL